MCYILRYPKSLGLHLFAQAVRLGQTIGRVVLLKKPIPAAPPSQSMLGFGPHRKYQMDHTSMMPLLKAERVVKSI
jgi:hypothetical protein